jgi:large subunit ribosomal protein L22
MKTAYQGSMEKCARAVGANLPVSRKIGYEMSNALRGMEVAKAIRFLDDVILLKRAVPYKRHNFDVSHQAGKTGPAKFPIKLAGYYLKLLKSAKANAIDLGLNGESLKIVHIAATHGTSQYHYGRQKRSQFKVSNVDLIVKEVVLVDGKEEKVKKVKKEKTEKPIVYVDGYKRRVIAER